MIMAKAAVYSQKGEKVSDVSLPKAFEQKVSDALIRRAAISDQTKTYQSKGNDIWAGVRTSAKYRGVKDSYASLKNQGGAMLPREIQPKGRHGRVRRIPSSVKGRRAHPPKVTKVIVERINKKEYAKALESAMAASASVEFVKARGHSIDEKISLPIILDESADSIAKTSDAKKMFEAIGVGSDMKRATKAKPRSGVGARKGGVKRAKSMLVVVAGEKSKLAKAAKNLAGFDVVTVDKLRVLDWLPEQSPEGSQPIQRLRFS